MRILFQTYNTCFQNKSGGVQVRFKRIYEELRKLNIDVALFDKYSDKVSDFDILHIFHLDTENLSLIKCAKQSNKKVVISTVVNTVGGKHLDFYRFLLHFPLQTVYKMNYQSLHLADLIITETNTERSFIAKHYRVDEDKIVVIPNGADDYSNADDSIYKIFNGEKKKYILQVGRFDSNKNQKRMIEAMKDTGIELVFIGGPGHSSQSYYDDCVRLAEGYNNIHFLGWIDNDSPLLKSAFAHAKTLVLPSFMETFGMVLIEGAIAGANLVMSNTLPILDYEEFAHCPVFDPANINEIRSKVMEAYTLEQSELNQRIRERFTWEAVVKEHIECYMNLQRK